MENLIRFDWAMKRLLRDKSNYVVLEGFLSTLLEEDVHICKFLESESNQADASDKFNRADILAEDSKGELLIIEVQNNRELDYFHRILYGVSKTIAEYIGLGDAYSKVRKCIPSISFILIWVREKIMCITARRISVVCIIRMIFCVFLYGSGKFLSARRPVIFSLNIMCFA